MVRVEYFYHSFIHAVLIASEYTFRFCGSWFTYSSSSRAPQPGFFLAFTECSAQSFLSLLQRTFDCCYSTKSPSVAVPTSFSSSLNPFVLNTPVNFSISFPCCPPRHRGCGLHCCCLLVALRFFRMASWNFHYVVLIISVLLLLPTVFAYEPSLWLPGCCNRACIFNAISPSSLTLLPSRVLCCSR